MNLYEWLTVAIALAALACQAIQTFKKDAEWIADLLQHGLLRPSFIPPAPQRELRELTCYRSSLVVDCAHIINRFQKVLEDTNLKLASVVTDVTGVSARAILRAYLKRKIWPRLSNRPLPLRSSRTRRTPG